MIQAVSRQVQRPHPARLRRRPADDRRGPEITDGHKKRQSDLTAVREIPGILIKLNTVNGRCAFYVLRGYFTPTFMQTILSDMVLIMA